METDEVSHRVKDRYTYDIVDLMHLSETDTFDSQAPVMNRAKTIWAILSYRIKVLSGLPRSMLRHASSLLWDDLCTRVSLRANIIGTLP